jgi:Intracellular proteinase inhibitor
MLIPAMSVQVSGDSVQLELRLSNGGQSPVRLAFATSQRYDFAVTTEAGDTLWRWSQDLMFAQAVSAETIEPAADLTFRAAWETSGRTGVFRAVGRVVAENRPFELETEFEIPGG